MNHKFINKDTFEIMNNVFEVDEDIAETISILNQKGYYTKYCCSGHVKDPRLYEIYKYEQIEEIERKLGYIVNNGNNILMPYVTTHIYIMFIKKYSFDNLPFGFSFDDDYDIIEKEIDYYDKDIKKNPNEVDKEIKVSNKYLLDWALSLPKNIT